MKYLLLSLLAVGMLSWPAVAAAEDSIWRVEFDLPETVTVQQPEGFWGRIRVWLGARSYYKPTPGTKLKVNSSAYASSPYQTDNTPCITAAGTRVRPGVVATNFLPMGTIISINGERYIVEDRMNSRYKGRYLDIWFPSTSEALEFGRKKLDIVILEYGQPGQEVRTETSATVGPLKRTSLRFRATASVLMSWVTANVNRHDVDCGSQES